MAEESRIRQAGLAGAAGAAIFIVAMLMFAFVGESNLPWLQQLLIAVAAPLLALELLALHRRTPEQGGGLGQIGFVIALIGLALVTIGMLGLLLGTLLGNEIAGAWTAWILGLCGTFTGLAIFATTGLRAAPTPRAAWAAVLVGGAGAQILLLAVSATSDQVSGKSNDLITGLLLAAIIVLFAGWAALGYSLWSERREHAAQVRGTHA